MSTVVLARDAGLSSILQAIGRTPLVRLRLPEVPAAVEVWGKCEWFNPGGSIKDRTALALVEDAEERGCVLPGRSLIESSSGNTAVGLALVARARGYPLTLVMPESVAPERRRLCEAYGAHIILTDAFSGSDGAMEKARELAAESPERYVYTNQYGNPANPRAHYRGTGPEIWEQTNGRITHLVAGLGTSGTLTGAARALKERNPRVRAVAVMPDQGLHGLEGLKHMPSARVPEIYSRSAHDALLCVSTEDALAAAGEVLRGQGLLVGHSAGAALHAAAQVARGLRFGVVVAMLADGGERYLGGTP